MSEIGQKLTKMSEIDPKQTKWSKNRPSHIFRIMSQGENNLYHLDGDEGEDYIEEDQLYIDIGNDTEEDLNIALREMFENAKLKGLSEKRSSVLEKLLKDCCSVFRIRLGYTKPTAVKQMKIDQIKDVKPVRVRSRRYTTEGRAWLGKYVKALVDMNFLVPTPDASWQAAPLLVAKRNSKAKFRLAIDLRPVNAATIKQAWPMPNLDSEVYDFAGSKFFAVLDFCSGYWQLPVDPESWDACGIVTPKGTYSSTRVLPGLTNATVHFQSTVEPLFAELRDHLKAWLDDFNLHAKTEDELLSVFKRFLQICQEKNLFLSAKKCQLFKKEVTWCAA